MRELLVLSGQSAMRLLLWPGGLGLLALLLSLWRGRGQPTPLHMPSLLACALPLLALALLPLPFAPPLARDIDLLTTLLLLEAPCLLALEYRRREGQHQQVGHELGALLNSYMPLGLAALVLAEGAGGLNLGTLGGAERNALLLGALCWVLAAAGLMASNPQRAGNGLLASAMMLRGLGHWALAVVLLLPAMPAMPSELLRLLSSLVAAFGLVAGAGWLRRQRPRLLEPTLCLLLLGWTLWRLLRPS